MRAANGAPTGFTKRCTDSTRSSPSCSYHAAPPPRRLSSCHSGVDDAQTGCSRRDAVLAVLAGAVALGPAAAPSRAALSALEPMAALKGKDYGKPRMKYADYVTTPSGLEYSDIKVGSGESPKAGDELVLDWDGYTIGYYGRPFEARNKSKGGSFTGDNKEFLHFVLGSHTVIPAFEEAVAGMKVGGIRRIIVPQEIGYLDNDYNKQGPKPSTFSGERALGFVLGNQGMIDKTLLFDLELIRIQRP